MSGRYHVIDIDRIELTWFESDRRVALIVRIDALYSLKRSERSIPLRSRREA